MSAGSNGCFIVLGKWSAAAISLWAVSNLAMFCLDKCTQEERGVLPKDAEQAVPVSTSGLFPDDGLVPMSEVVGELPISTDYSSGYRFSRADDNSRGSGLGSTLTGSDSNQSSSSRAPSHVKTSKPGPFKPFTERFRGFD